MLQNYVHHENFEWKFYTFIKSNQLPGADAKNATIDPKFPPTNPFNN
jgi:hypothetical protein